MHDPTTVQMKAIKRIFQYLKGTIDDGLTYNLTSGPHSGYILSTYTDADWAGDLDECRPVKGLLYLY